MRSLCSLQGLSEESLAMAMQAFAKLDYRHKLFFDAAIQECLDRQPKSFSPSQLTAIVHSLAILRAEDVLSEILVDLSVLSASKRIDQFSPGELAHLIWSYTRLFRYHGDVKVLDSLAKNLFLKVHELDGRLYCTIAFGCNMGIIACLDSVCAVYG